ncbi:MAG: acetyl-CoA carboxylase biotin carboxyl carrier protein [Burkholderia sp.]|nr:acetyl-CoA carboxylase biotin carboxyl carrier protein [Burkholderia sp.]
MDLRKIKNLIDLVSKSGISKLEIIDGKNKVRIVNNFSSNRLQNLNKSNMHFDKLPVSTDLSSCLDEENRNVAVEKYQDHILKSPMIGKFYRASSPYDSPFVQIGDMVRKGQTLCIIEAMKLLNEIESDKSGFIKEILVENGQYVEYGQALFVIC